MQTLTLDVSQRPLTPSPAETGRRDSRPHYGRNTPQRQPSKEATPTDPPKRGLSVGIDSAIKKHGFPTPQEQTGMGAYPPIFFVRQISTPPYKFFKLKLKPPPYLLCDRFTNTRTNWCMKIILPAGSGTPGFYP